MVWGKNKAKGQNAQQSSGALATSEADTLEHLFATAPTPVPAPEQTREMPTSDGQQGVIELEELESGPEPEHRSARAILRPDTTVVEHAEAPAPYSPPAAASASSPSRDGAAVSRIGASIRVEGQLSGSEDMVVEGTVDGLVCLRENQLMVAAQGCVQAEIQARAVIVLGKVVGNISATELVQVMPSGCMDGDIRAGRVVLADGAKFRGNIQMGWEPEPEVEPHATRPAASP